MIMKRLIFVSMVFVMLSACGSRTAEYYEQHPEEMTKKWAECSKMSSAEVMADRECAAVSRADSKRFFGDHVDRPLQGKPEGRPTKQF